MEIITRGSHITCTYCSLMFFIAYAFKGQVHALAGQVHALAGQVKIVSHLSCRTSAILKYFVHWSLMRHLVPLAGPRLWHKVI